MRTLIILFLTCALVGCKTQKNIAASQSTRADSLAHSEHHRTIAVIDSAIRNIDFSFDTLKINIERPYSVGDSVACLPEVIRIKAVKGRVIDRLSAVSDSVEYFNRLDAVAYKQSADETSTEYTATTRLYNPPDATAVMIIALILAALLLFIRYRKR